MPRRKFPETQRVLDGGALFIPTDGIVALYNDANGTAYERPVEVVRSWFEKEAHARGWSRVLFPSAYPEPTRIAGAVLIR